MSLKDLLEKARDVHYIELIIEDEENARTVLYHYSYAEAMECFHAKVIISSWRILDTETISVLIRV